MTTAGAVKTSSLFGSPSGESPSDSNPFAFITLNKPQSLEQVQSVTHTHDVNVPAAVAAPGMSLSHQYSSQPFDVAQKDVPVQQPSHELGSEYPAVGAIAGRPTQQLAANETVVGSSQGGGGRRGGNGADFFDSIPPSTPLPAQVSNPLQHQLSQGSLVNRAGPLDSTTAMWQLQPPPAPAAAPESEHNRADSLPSIAPYPVANSGPGSLQESSDFYSSIQPQSLPTITQEGQAPPQVLKDNRTSISAPTTAIHQLLPPANVTTELEHISPPPLSLHPTPEYPLREEPARETSPVPRPPSNADNVSYVQHHFGTPLNIQHPSYPITNADLHVPQLEGIHPGLMNEHTLTNATNVTPMAPITTPEANTNMYTAALNQPETVPHLTEFSSENPLSNLPPTEDELNDSTSSPSVSSLLQGSQEDFTSTSPLRLLPPAPVTAGGDFPPPSTTSSAALSSAPMSLGSPVTQESLGGPSLLPPAPLEQVLHPVNTGLNIRADHSEEVPLPGGVYEPQTNAALTPVLSNATNKERDSEGSEEWEIVDNVPPHAEVAKTIQQQTPVFSTQGAAQLTLTPGALDVAQQQTVAQLSSLTMEGSTAQQGGDRHVAPPSEQLTSRGTVAISSGQQQSNYGNPHGFTNPPSNLTESAHPATIHPTTVENAYSPSTNLHAYPAPVGTTAPNAPPTATLQAVAAQQPPLQATPPVPVSTVGLLHPPQTQVPSSSSAPSGPPTITHPVPLVSLSANPHTQTVQVAASSAPPQPQLPSSTSVSTQQVLASTGAAVQPQQQPTLSSTVQGPPQTSPHVVSVLPKPEPVSLPSATAAISSASLPPTAATEQAPPTSTTTTTSTHQPASQGQVQTVSNQPLPVTSEAPLLRTSQPQDNTVTPVSAADHPVTAPYHEGRRDSDYREGGGRPPYDEGEHYRQPDYYRERRDPYYPPRGDGYHRGEGERDHYGDGQRHPSAYSERGPDQYEYRPPPPQRDPSRPQYDIPPYHDYRDGYHSGPYRRYGDEYHPRGGGSGGGYGYYGPYPPSHPHHHRDPGYGGGPRSHSQYYDDRNQSQQYGYDERYGGRYHHTEDPHRYGEQYSQYGGHYGEEYSTDPRYEYDERGYHQPTPYSDPSLLHQAHDAGYDTQHQQQAYQDPQYQPQQPQQQQDHLYQSQDFNPAEASAIYGGQNHFEISQFDSPSTRHTLPQHPQHQQHESTAYLDGNYGDEYAVDQSMQYHPSHVVQDEYNYHQEGYQEGQHHGGQYTEYTDSGQVVVGEVPPYPADGQYYTQEGYSEQQQWAPIEATPIEATPPPPPRETPELFAHPHVRASFGFGGQLVTILPNKQSTTVEVCCVKGVVVSDPETSAFVEAVDASQGPFIVGDTPKSHVIKFATQEAQKCRDSMKAEPESPSEREVNTNLEDEALMWDFLVLLCQQNGVVLPSDVADLLMKDRSLSISSTTHFGASTQEESLESLRQLLLSGRKKDALDLACSRSLWGHALMLASRMDEQSRTYVVNRFTASLMSTDPLSTFYTLLLGRSPSAVKPEGLARAGDWRPHLAMILANRTTKLDNDAIVNLGDSLLSQGRLHAAHLCYYLANVHFGAYGNTETKYSLLGVDHTQIKVGSYPTPCDLQKMEVFEYAMSLNKQDFTLPYFQTFKYLFVLKLAEAGFVAKALKYCEQISHYVVKGPHSYTPTFLQSLADLAEKLHHQNSPFGVVENELPSWLVLLQQSVNETLASDYNPSVLSPSPAFSSVSQTYTNPQPLQSQPIIGLQLQGPYLSVPGTGGSSVKSSAVSSKEGSVVAAGAGGVSSEAIAAKTLGATASTTTTVAHQLELYSQSVEQQQQQQQQQQVVYQGQDAQPTVGGGMQYEQVGGIMMVAPNQTQPAVGDVATLNGAQSHADAVLTNPPLTQAPQEGMGVNALQQFQQSQAQAEYYSQYGLQQPVMSGEYTQTYSDALSQQQPNYTDFGVATVPSHQQPQATQQQDGQPQVTEPQDVPPSSLQPSSQQPPLYDPTLITSDHTHSSSGPAHPISGGGVSSDVSPYDYWQNLVPPSEEELQKRQQDESSATTDSHVSQKEEQGENKEERKEKEKSGKEKDKKDEKKGQQSSGGGGWGFSLLKYIIPNKKNQAHLPDDKNPRIIYDKEKKQWIDLDADEQEQAGPAPPPTDVQLNKTTPPQQPPGGPVPPTGSGSGGMAAVVARDSTDGAPSADSSAVPSSSSNMYSRQSSKRGRLGTRSKYVDVLNPGGSSAASGGSQAPQPPPPGPPPMAAMMPGSTFTGTFFVPQPDPDSSSFDGGATPTPAAATVGDSTTDLGTSETPSQQHQQQQQVSQETPAHQQYLEQVEQTQPTDTPQAQMNQQEHYQYQQQQQEYTQQQQQQQQQVEYAQQQQPQVYSQQETYPSQTPTQDTTHQQQQQAHVQAAQDHHDQRVERTSENATQQAGALQPQFFNPSAFAPVSAFPAASEPQDDSLSTVSLMSESSQEVSRYMNTQHTTTRTTSAGYSRLKQGIRGVKGYPTKQVGGTARSGHTSQGIPPTGSARSSFQQRQHWQ